MEQQTKTDSKVNPNEGAYMKAMIKIAHPDWTKEQIEAEYQNKKNKTNDDEDNGCEFCSS